MDVRLTNQRGQLAEKVYVKGSIDYFAERKYHENFFRTVLEKYNI